MRLENRSVKDKNVLHQRKTKEGFLSWLREVERDNKRTVEEPIILADRTIARALMVWVDDGGAIQAYSNPFVD